MTITTDSLKADLGDLTRQSVRAAKADNDLTRGAEERRAFITARLAELRPTVLTDDAAASEYDALIAERGQLDLNWPRDHAS